MRNKIINPIKGILIRLLIVLLGFIYFLLVITIPLWWFIPSVLIGKSSRYVLETFFDFIGDLSIKYMDLDGVLMSRRM